MTKKSSDELDRESAAFWESVERGAKEAQKLPQWMKAGLLVDPVNFVTCMPEQPAASSKKRK